MLLLMVEHDGAIENDLILPSEVIRALPDIVRTSLGEGGCLAQGNKGKIRNYGLHSAGLHGRTKNNG